MNSISTEVIQVAAQVSRELLEESDTVFLGPSSPHVLELSVDDFWRSSLLKLGLADRRPK